MPNWSPDGKQIVFATNRGFGGGYEIYKMNADGSGATHLTANLAFDYSPVWSPDGSTILFMSQRDGNAGIYAMDPDFSDPFNLTRYAATDDEPDWQPQPR